MKHELYIPKKSNALNEEFFARHADIVARDLLGRTLVRERKNQGSLYALVREVSAFETDAKPGSMTEGALYAPGTLVVSTKHGKSMLDFSTYKICEPSCVTLVAADVYDSRGKKEFVQGPGNLAQVLGIDKDSFNGLPMRLSPLWIGGNAIEQNKIITRKLTGLPKSCKGYFYFK